MYAARVGGPTRKARLNLTIDPDIYRASRRVFNVMDMNMSGFIETQLALFLQMMQPFESLIEQAEAGEVDPASVKSALRAFNAHGNVMVGEQLVEFGKAQKEIQQFIEQEHTDKK